MPVVILDNNLASSPAPRPRLWHRDGLAGTRLHSSSPHRFGFARQGKLVWHLAIASSVSTRMMGEHLL